MAGLRSLVIKIIKDIKVMRPILTIVYIFLIKVSPAQVCLQGLSKILVKLLGI